MAFFPLRAQLFLWLCALIVFAPHQAQAEAAVSAAPPHALEPPDAGFAAEPSSELRLVLQNEPAPQKGPRWFKPGLLPASLAVFPGFFLHGTGAFVLGERTTARRLALTEAAGLAAFLAGGSLLAVTGTSRRLIGVLAPVTIAGFGLFMLSFLADVYAASSGGRDAHAPNFVPKVDAQAGYAYVYDPQFAFRSFLTLHADLRANAFRASPQAWVALDDNNQRFQLEFAYRALGRTEHRSARDGSFLEFVTGVRYHRFQTEGFAVLTPAWYLDGRFDLERMGESLRGSFVEGHLGAGLELYDFRVPGSTLGDNATGLLLARFGFGVYFGDGGRNSGEASVYYDHRHDDFAAGLGVSGIPGGILGHFGLRGHYFFTRAWGLSGLVEVGSALVTGLSLRYRYAPMKGGPL